MIWRIYKIMPQKYTMLVISIFPQENLYSMEKRKLILYGKKSDQELHVNLIFYF